MFKLEHLIFALANVFQQITNIFQQFPISNTYFYLEFPNKKINIRISIITNMYKNSHIE